MNNDIRKYLKSLITVEKMQLLSNKHLLEDVVDKINVKEYKKEYFLISSSLDENIPQDILLAIGINDCALLKSNLVLRLENNLGLSKEVAIWTVETWMCVLNMDSENINDDNAVESSEEKEFTLIKDEFETYEEWKNRILKYNPIKVGEACLIKELYDIDTGKFPIKIQIDCVLDDIELIDSDTYIIVNRDVARNLYSTKESNGVYLTLDFDEYGLCVRDVEINWGEVKIPVTNALFNITIRDENSQESILKSKTILSEHLLSRFDRTDVIYKGWRYFTHSIGPELPVTTVHMFKESKYDNIYKSRVGTNEYVKLNSYSSQIIGVVNDWIYFVNSSMENALFKMDIGGKNVTKLSNLYKFTRNGSKPRISKDYIYFTSDYKENVLCKLSFDGVGTVLDKGYIDILSIDDEYINYISRNYGIDDNKYKLCKIDINTNRMVQKIEVNIKKIEDCNDVILCNLKSNELYIKYEVLYFRKKDLVSAPPIIHRITLV